MKESAQGDLEAAILVYRKIVEEHPNESGVAAKAQLHIGMCYEKLGRERAAEAYQKVIERFPGETEVVQQARERLQALEQAAQVVQPAEGAGAEKTRAVMEELDRKRAQVRSYRATLSIKMEMMGNPVVTTGAVRFRRPGLLRMEMTGSTPVSQSISVFDGKVNWTHQPQINMVAKIDIERIRGEFPDFDVNNSVFRPFQGLVKKSIRYVRSTSLNGAEVSVFQGDAKDTASKAGYGQFNPAWGEIWVGMGDGLARKTVMYRDTGVEMMTMEATVEAVNPAIPDSVFAFTPPEGASVVDMTDMTMNMKRQVKDKEAEEETHSETGSGDLEDMMKEMKAKRKATRSYRAQVVRQMRMMGTMMTSHTSEWANEGKFRGETTTSMAPGEMVSIGDSLVSWTYHPHMKMAQKIDQRRLKEALKETGEEEKPGSFYGMAKETVQYVGKEPLEEEAVCVFEGESVKGPAALKQHRPDRIKIWIGEHDGLMRKKLGYSKAGEEVMSEVRSNVEVNIAIPDSVFVFVPPEGVQVVDFTERAIKMAQQMMKKNDKDGTDEK